MLESGLRRRIRLLKLLIEIHILGSALIARWVRMIPGTPTMITDAFVVIIVVSAGLIQMMSAIGGGFVITVTTESIISSIMMLTETKSVAPRCQAIIAYALSAMRCAVGILENIISGTRRSRSRRL